MSSQPQIQANRLNAQKSTGPKTQKGKTVVSQNALKHGLSARHDVVITESQEDFDLHRDSLLEELAPQTPMESMLADRIVSLSWRLKRADQIQNQTIDAMHEQSKTNPLAKLAKSFGLKALPTRLAPGPLPGLSTEPNNAPEPNDPQHDLTLGRLALKDFANERVLDRLLMYERRIENSLHKTLIELQRLTLIRNLTPISKPPTLRSQNNLAPCTAGGSPQRPAQRTEHPDSPPQNREYATPSFCRRRNDDDQTTDYSQSPTESPKKPRILPILPPKHPNSA